MSATLDMRERESAYRQFVRANTIMPKNENVLKWKTCERSSLWSIYQSEHNHAKELECSQMENL